MSRIAKSVQGYLDGLKWVYGTNTGKWYLVDRFDRDYNYGISQDQMKLWGKEKAKREYLSINLI